MGALEKASTADADRRSTVAVRTTPMHAKNEQALALSSVATLPPTSRA